MASPIENNVIVSVSFVNLLKFFTLEVASMSSENVLHNVTDIRTL